MAKRVCSAIGCLGLCALAASQLRGAGPETRIFEVTRYGAVADDQKSDQAAFRDALAAAQKSGGGIVKFPAGVFETGMLENVGLRGVSIEGEGADKTVVRATGANRYILEFHGSNDIAVRKMAFDANGATRYGGVVFTGCKRVTIENTRYFDGKAASRPSGKEDIYSFVFARGEAPHEDITIRDNLIEDLQLEVDHIWRATITGNVVRRPARTAGIGLFSLQEKPAKGKDVCGRDVLIEKNTIEDLSDSYAGIAVHLDPAVHPKGTFLNNVEYRNIKILDNVIRVTSKSQRNQCAISIGQTDNSKATRGVVFDGIVIQGNKIEVAKGADIAGENYIQLKTSRPYLGPDFHFTGTVVRDNELSGDIGRKGLVRVLGGANDLIEENNLVNKTQATK